jgi:hypothetical protein
MSFQMAFHFALLVDSLDQGNYVSTWKSTVVSLFTEFKRAVSEARLQHRQSDDLLPHHERFGRLLSGSGSDTADVIRIRHAFMLSEIYPKLNLVVRDPTRCFDVLEREVIWNRDRGVCQCPNCVRPERRVPFRDANIHHIVEHSAGGSTSLRNGILICVECHTDRQSMKALTPIFQDYITKLYSGSRFDREQILEESDNDLSDDQNSQSGSRIRIIVNWGAMDIDRPVEKIMKQNDTETIVELLKLLIEIFKDPIKNQLTEGPIIRFPLSATPETTFLNHSQNRPYSSTKIPGTNLYFCPHSERSQKVERLKALFSRLTLPDGSEFPEDCISISTDATAAS